MPDWPLRIPAREPRSQAVTGEFCDGTAGNQSGCFLYLSIQACRAVAALLVALFHLGLLSANNKYFGAKGFDIPFSFGYAGVDFFFVLSGFLISYTHRAELGTPIRLARYVQKRATRIYPTYWIIYASVASVALAIPALRAGIPHDWSTNLKALGLLPMHLSGQWGGAPVLIVAWTLQYEVCFYALFGAAIFRRSLGFALICALVWNYASCFNGQCGFPRNFFASNLILLFALGTGLAPWCCKPVKSGRPLLIAILGGVAFSVAGVLEAVYGKEIFPVDPNIVYGLFSAIVIAALVRAEDAQVLTIRSPLLRLFGDSSYCFYLIHHPLMVLLCKLAIVAGLTGVMGAAVAAPIILGACVSTAILFHCGIEKPMLRFLRRMWSRTDGS